MDKLGFFWNPLLIPSDFIYIKKVTRLEFFFFNFLKRREGEKKPWLTRLIDSEGVVEGLGR